MAGWTDYIPDWSSKDKLRLQPIYQALSALRGAVNERITALGTGTPIPVINKLYPVKYYVDLIDTRIKWMVPRFVNHTINNGNLSGLTSIPYWTNGSIRNYGLRQDGTQKEMGFLGEIISPIDSEMFFTEISIGVNIEGNEVDIPSLVPTLTTAELTFMITEGYMEGAEIPQTILDKAISYAKNRIDRDQSPFASDGKQTYRTDVVYRHSRLMPLIDWVYQQYQILNKLRWTLAQISGVYEDYGQLKHSQIFGVGNYVYSDSNTSGNNGHFEDFTYTSNYAILAPYSNIVWGIASPYTSGGAIRGVQSLMGSAGITNVIAMGKDSFKANKIKLVTDYKTPKVSVMIGGTYRRYRGRYQLVGDIWTSVTEIYINEPLQTIHSRDITKNADNSFFVILDENLALPEPADYPFSDDTSRVCNNADIELSEYSIICLINEFDGSDGFQFKDW